MINLNYYYFNIHIQYYKERLNLYRLFILIWLTVVNKPYNSYPVDGALKNTYTSVAHLKFGSSKYNNNSLSFLESGVKKRFNKKGIVEML